MWNKPATMLIAAACLAAASSALAVDITGVWSTQDGAARVRLSPCGRAMCGTILSLKEPNDPATGKPKLDKFNQDAGKRARPVVGIELAYGMKPNGAHDRWDGSLYNPRDGNIYKGSLIVRDPLTLKLQGCVLGGLICQSETWTRTQ
jgi:uncharacterized protein (DUF2147 family)